MSPQSTVHSPQKKSKGRTIDCSGFTLIEVLVAIVILASGFVIIAQAMGRTQEVLRISQNLLRASLVAEERFSEIEIQLREDRKLTTSSRDGEENFPGARKFKWRQNIRPYYAEGIEDQTRINQVDVTVAWSEGARQSQEQLSSVFLNRDKEETV